MDLKGITIASYIPGRVRLKALPLKGDPVLAQKITALFSAIQGIQQVEANPLTGSLLVHFNPGELRTPDSARLLGEAIQILAPQINPGQIDFWLEKLT